MTNEKHATSNASKNLQNTIIMSSKSIINYITGTIWKEDLEKNKKNSDKNVQ